MKLVSHYIESSLIILMLVLTSGFVYFQDCRHRMAALREATEKSAQSLSRELETWHQSRLGALEILAAMMAATSTTNRPAEGGLFHDTVRILQTLTPDITGILFVTDPATDGPWVPTIHVPGPGGHAAGYIRAALSPESIIQPYIKGSKGDYIIALLAPDGDAVYKSANPSTDEQAKTWQVATPVELTGTTYSLHINPSRQTLAASAYPVNMIVLVVGVITTLGVAIVLNKELRLRMDQRERYEAHLKQLSALTIESRDQEKHELGRRLHDELGHALSLARMDIESLKTAKEPGPEKIDRAAAQIGLAVDVVRALSASLSLPGFFDLGFIAPLRHLVEEFQTTTGIQTRFEATGSGPDPTVQRQVCLYRVVQEALTNTLRHAEASQATVTVTRRKHRIACTVRDDGKGFVQDRQEKQLRGIGLLGMSQRAEQAGGSLQISSKPGQGTEITCSFPLQA